VDPLPIPLSIVLSAARDEGLPPELELAGRLYLPVGDAIGVGARTAPGLVVGHGAGSRAANHDDFCLEACRQGFAVLAFDFRGHGGSQGSGDGPLEQDILAAVRFLRTHPAVDPGLICYRGSSMGGFYGLKAEPQASFTAMALLCPAGEDVILDALEDREDTETTRDTESPGDRGGKNTSPSTPPWTSRSNATRWDRSRLRAYFERQDSRQLAARVDCPVLLVHARPDTRVPFAHSLLLAQYLRTDTTLLALERGSHTSAQHDPALHAYTAAWLRDRVAEARALRA
jgi:dipeptidyl aminopeptidase/acylaminoacyl peptidase